MNLVGGIKTRLQALSNPPQRLSRIIAVLLILATVLIMISHLVFLTSYPQVFIDEPWNANVAWTWLKTGVNFDTIHSPYQQ